MRHAYEQNFEAHVLATISSGLVTKCEMAKGYMKQANEILNDTIRKQDEKDEEISYTITTDDEDAIPKDPNQLYSDDESTKESPMCKNNLKRKLEDELPGYDGLAFLFNDSNEDTIIEKIDENTLEEERKLPLAGDNK
ncbi:4950_t:CDS:2, partial [Ambispora gerdemannii]